MDFWEMQMHYFGEPWGAPLCDPDDEGSVERAPTPVGEECFAHACNEAIKEGDQGFLIPFMPYSGPPSLKAWHRKCFRQERA